jgi:hypothetical protein
LLLGGTKAKPMIVCADKECGYKRAVEEASPGELGEASGLEAAAAAPA